MKIPVLVLVLCASAVRAVGAPAVTPPAAPALGDLSRVGSVQFPTSCDPASQQEFDRGLALLHSFFYEEARRVFMRITESDPQCAMAWWGVAMTYYHPLWTAPDSSELAAGQAAIDRARAGTKQGDRERGWIRAAQAFYAGVDLPPAGDDAAPSCHGAAMADPRGRADCFRREMEQITMDHPEDQEAAAFFALSLLATAVPGDPTLSNQKRAEGILAPHFAAEPNHPGFAHYLIHATDFPPLARDGLVAANTYASIAPWVPHALHMPSHIYTRLGMWKETVESNIASAAASRTYEAEHHPGAAAAEELHALDYLTYGYLQSANDAKAGQILDRLAGITKTHPEVDFAGAYAFGAIPARIALERRQWREAAALQIRPMAFWSKLPFAEGHIVYARAVGAAKSGDLPTARVAADRLEQLSRALTEPRYRYFAQQMDLQRRAALGLITMAEGRKAEAVRMLRAAAASEDSLGKHPVSPGSILPIRELLAEALLDSGHPGEAVAEYEASLKLYPARYNGVAGAARAAERAGRRDVARKYYTQLLALARDGDGARPEIARARLFSAKR